MEKLYDGDAVLLKLLYYCNQKREVYFKRADVTEYLSASSPFDIPKKQGFDGNLSYFGYDIENDIDSKRILLLRGQKLNERCLSGQLRIEQVSNQIRIVDEDPAVFQEIDNLIKNKTAEAAVFTDRKRTLDELQLIESDVRLFGNKKMYQRDGKYYIFPDIIFGSDSNTPLYEIVNAESLGRFTPNIIFPIYDKENHHQSDKVLVFNEILPLENDFCYFIYRSDDQMFAEYDIQDLSNERIINLINKLEYDLTGKETTRKVLNNIRLSVGALRTLALSRDHYRCVLCDISEPKLLVCSHIKPWRTNDGRLSLDNVC